MALTEEQRKIVDERFAKIRGICPGCNSYGPFNLHADIIRMPSDSDGKGHPFIASMCSKCGRTDFYSAIVWGIVSE